MTFVNKNLEIISQKLTWDLMTRSAARFSGIFFPVSFLTFPSCRETSILQYYCIYFFVYDMALLFS